MYELIATVGMIFFYDGELKSQKSTITYESRAHCIERHLEQEELFQENWPNYLGFSCTNIPPALLGEPA